MEEDTEEGIYVPLPSYNIRPVSLSGRSKLTNPSSADIYSPDTVSRSLEAKPELKRIPMKHVEISDRSKKGFLSKRGGENGNKGWDRRWFEYENGVLNYFKGTKCQNTIPLRNMKGVRATENKLFDGKHGFLFELDTMDRTFFLSSESLHEMTEWMVLLGAVIQNYKPTSEEKMEGGSMAEPDKAGWIKLKGTHFLEGWTKIYFVIKGEKVAYYLRHEDWVQENCVEIFESLFLGVSLGQGGKKAKNYQFMMKTRYRNYEFQAESHAEMVIWTDAIQSSIQTAYSVRLYIYIYIYI